MKWRDEAAIYYPHTRLGGDSFFILCEDGTPLAETTPYYEGSLLLEHNGN